jgi:ABC-2 type transport system permease protein
MRTILIVAAFEFWSTVRRRSFLVGLLLVPLLAGLALVLQAVAESRPSTGERRFAVVDRTGSLYDAVSRRAAEQHAPAFVPSLVAPGSRPADDVRADLSDRVERGDLFAFVEIPPDALDPAARAKILYFSNQPTYDALPAFLSDALGDEIRARMLAAANIGEDLLRRIDQPVTIERFGLASREPGGPARAEKVNVVATMLVPVVLIMLVFFVTASGAGRLLNGVLEEKASRIGEMLLGFVTPFDLMMGKLVASVGVSGLIGLFYLVAGVAIGSAFGHAPFVSVWPVLAFFVFLTLNVVFYGAIFLGIGAACADAKDTQSLSMPAMLLVMIPMFCWGPVLKDPSSGFSVLLSLFPPATPSIMLMRLLLPPGPPAWQIALGIVLTTASTFVAVWAAAKVFRTGMLLQGKSASVREMVGWMKARDS